MQLHVVILILKFAYLGDGNRMLLKGIFALLAFHTNQHYTNHNRCDRNLALVVEQIAGVTNMSLAFAIFFLGFIVLHSSCALISQ